MGRWSLLAQPPTEPSAPSRRQLVVEVETRPQWLASYAVGCASEGLPAGKQVRMSQGAVEHLEGTFEAGRVGQRADDGTALVGADLDPDDAVEAEPVLVGDLVQEGPGTLQSYSVTPANPRNLAGEVP